MERRRFQRLLYQSQRSFESVSSQQALLEDRRGLVMDRGTVDSAAYLAGGIEEFERAFGTTIRQEYGRYDVVICLAPPSEEVFSANHANNGARREAYGEVLTLAHLMKRVWGAHPRFHYVDGATWEEKSARALGIITSHFD